MKTKTITAVSILGVLVFALGGCAVAIVGAGAAAGVGYVRGDLEATLKNDVEPIYKASLEALDQLELAVISREKDALGAKIISRTSEDKKVQIKLKQTQGGITELSIRIGIFGDEALSRLIYDKIRENL